MSTETIHIIIILVIGQVVAYLVGSLIGHLSASDIIAAIRIKDW